MDAQNRKNKTVANKLTSQYSMVNTGHLLTDGWKNCKIELHFFLPRGCQECPYKRPLMYSYLGVVSSDGRYMESASDSGIEARDELTDLWVSRDSASRWDTLESVPMIVERERDLAHWSKRSLSWSSERVSGVSICWQKINQPMVR